MLPTFILKCVYYLILFQNICLAVVAYFVAIGCTEFRQCSGAVLEARHNVFLLHGLLLTVPAEFAQLNEFVLYVNAGFCFLLQPRGGDEVQQAELSPSTVCCVIYDFPRNCWGIQVIPSKNKGITCNNVLFF